MFPLQKKLIPFESRGTRNSVFFETERKLILHFHKTNCVHFILSSLALSGVPKPTNEFESPFHPASYCIVILGGGRPQNQRQCGCLCAVGKWIVCIYLHYGSGKRVELFRCNKEIF